MVDKSHIAVANYLSACISRGLSKETIRWYRGILYKFSTTYPEIPRRPELIDQFIITNCHGGDERRHGYYRILRTFYRFLSRRYKIRNLMEFIDPPKRQRKTPHFLTPEDIQRLLSYPHISKIMAALLFLTDSGARLGELASLTTDMLDETPAGFTSLVKGKTGQRIIPISYETYHALMVNLPFDISPHWLGILLSRAFKNARVKGTAHTLRHTFGTLWQGDEFALQTIMGHSHFETTKAYRHLRTEYLSRQHALYSPLKYFHSTTPSML